MDKISVTGPKRELDRVIKKLYELKLLDIEEYDGELDTGSPFEEAEDLSELLVDIRSLLSKLPEGDYQKGRNVSIEELQEKIPEISRAIENSERDKAALERELSNIKEKLTYFRRLEGTGVEVKDLEGTETLDVAVVDIETDILSQELGSKSYHVFEGEKASVIVYRKDSEDVERVIQENARENYGVIETELDGNIKQVIKGLKERRKQLKKEVHSRDEKLEDLAEEWAPILEDKEEFLKEKVEKAEAPLNFATTKNAFIAEGWVPSERYREVKETLAEITEGKVYVQKEETEENPPVKHENNRFVQPFEDLTDLVAVPRYNELDPTFMLLITFPLFFGLMIGDVGYGLTSAIVFYAGMKMFQEASDIFKALMWTSGATVLFGLIYGEMFGFQIYESPFYRADYWTEIFYIAVGIGVAHVNLGLLFGAYNEYVNHGLMEAIYAKISWILLEIAAVGGYLANMMYGSTPGTAVFLGLGIPAIAMLYKGEGVEGVVEIPSLLSNIISYLRLFGVCMAAYTLAGTANAIAAPGLTSGTVLGVASGVIILIGAHTLLTFIKIMEGGIQGIRLHYVEMFGWFYEGGGRKYAPFGAKSK